MESIPHDRPGDVEYADEEESGQLAIGVAGEQRAIPGLAKPAVPAPVCPPNCGCRGNLDAA